MSVERLHWDSDFFSTDIGRARPPYDLDAIAASAEDQQIACVYIESEHRLGDPPRGELVLADERLRFRRQPGALTATESAPVIVRLGDESDLASLSASVEALVPWSRFSRDPRFGDDSARAMYWRWLERAARGDNEGFAVATREGTTIGFITTTRDDAPEIGLIATHAPGQGAGPALLRWAVSFVGEDRAIEVVTQAGNAAAVRLYQREGFEAVARTFAYHLWLDGNG